MLLTCALFVVIWFLVHIFWAGRIVRMSGGRMMFGALLIIEMLASAAITAIIRHFV